MLETAPSLSIFTNPTDEDANGVRSVNIGVSIYGTVVGSGDFSFGKPDFDLIDEEDGEGNNESGELIEGFENLGTEDFRVLREGSEEYYKDLLKKFPNHPLVLMYYANLLQNNGDFKGAEYYYLRATQADPKDGDILSRYAQLLWELYHDQLKALPYFEHSVQSAPEDSNVLAAYAKFLWETEDDKDEEFTHSNHFQQEETKISVPSVSHPAEEKMDIADTENYYGRMIEENPSDPRFLKSYAHFLYQSKGDLQSAEEYYSKAIDSDPQDGKVLSEYAKLVWELHHDQDKAGTYFDKAIQVAPRDSDVLAAYASFLWTIDEDDEVDEEVLAE